MADIYLAAAVIAAMALLYFITDRFYKSAARDMRGINFKFPRKTPLGNRADCVIITAKGKSTGYKRRERRE